MVAEQVDTSQSQLCVRRLIIIDGYSHHAYPGEQDRYTLGRKLRLKLFVSWNLHMFTICFLGKKGRTLPSGFNTALLQVGRSGTGLKGLKSKAARALTQRIKKKWLNADIQQ